MSHSCSPSACANGVSRLILSFAYARSKISMLTVILSQSFFHYSNLQPFTKQSTLLEKSPIYRASPVYLKNYTTKGCSYALSLHFARVDHVRYWNRNDLGARHSDDALLLANCIFLGSFIRATSRLVNPKQTLSKICARRNLPPRFDSTCTHRHISCDRSYDEYSILHFWQDMATIHFDWRITQPNYFDGRFLPWLVDEQLVPT